jgi:hypothetical protein
VWGIALVAEAAGRAVLAYVLTTGTFLAVTPVVNWIVLGSLIFFTIRYVRARRRDTFAAQGASTPSVVSVTEPSA